jgi:hypothetical protein
MQVCLYHCIRLKCQQCSYVVSQRLPN